MIVTDSGISLSGQHSMFKLQVKSESLTVRTGNGTPDTISSGAGSTGGNEVSSDLVTLSLESLQAEETSGTSAGEVSSAPLEPRLELLKQLVEQILHKKIRIFTLDGHDSSESGPKGEQASPRTPQTGSGIEYEYHESRYESESVSFAASGTIRTADGRETGFSLSFSLAREFYSEQNLEIRIGEAVKKDPLVINFSGTSAQLTSTRFSFDLDADGTAENIPLLAGTSGYLALDKNGDGRVTNGSELFGPLSGNGFLELSGYDQDGNNWIDENDQVFDRLSIWRKDSPDHEEVTTLKEAGVGAIYLGSRETPFDLKDANNELLGQVRESGVFLSEDGGAGIIQQIDLAV